MNLSDCIIKTKDKLIQESENTVGKILLKMEILKQKRIKSLKSKNPK